jgi:glycosyltransferase involved in cell wall biosynthesis
MAQEHTTLNILMVTPRYFPFIGGTETHVHEVGRRLVRDGFNVTVVSTLADERSQAQLPREETVEGMRILRIPAWPKNRDLYIAPEIARIIKQGQWDVVHCQGCHTFVPIIGMRAAGQAHIPYVVTFHTGGHSSSWRTKIRDMQWHLLSPLLSRARKLIGVSRFEADFFQHLLHLPAQQFAVVPNGVNISGHSPAAVQPGVETLIISSGRLEHYKGHHRLIEALPKIRERIPDARVLLLGNGPYETTLRALAQRLGVADCVEIRAIPPGQRDEMVNLLARAAVVVLLSEYESQGISVMEALSLGRPVLVAETSALQELGEKQLVRTVPLTSTPEQIAQAVIQQIEDPLVPAHLALPSWDDCAQQLADIYRTVAAQSQSLVVKK